MSCEHLQLVNTAWTAFSVGHLLGDAMEFSGGSIYAEKSDAEILFFNKNEPKSIYLVFSHTQIPD